MGGEFNIIDCISIYGTQIQIGGVFKRFKMNKSPIAPNTVKRKKLDDALSYFTEAREPIKVRGNLHLQLCLDSLENISTTKGLQPEHILELIDVIGTCKHAESISARLIKFLIPATFVPEKAIVKTISYLCTNKPSTNMQCLLLRWILVIYDYIDTKDDIHKLYGLIFFFLDNQTMMPYVCHLLFLLTRKEDVRMFRVRKLLSLQNRVGAQPYLIGLLSIYKLYYPNLVSMVLPKNKKLFFPSKDGKWKIVVEKVQLSRVNQNTLDTTVASERLQLADSSQIRGAPRSKRRKIDPVPIVHSNASSNIGNPGKDTVEAMLYKNKPFVQVSDLKALMQRPDYIEPPSQIGAVLRNELLQHYMSYSFDAVTVTRFSYWLQAILYEEILDRTVTVEDKERIDGLLTRVVSFSKFLQEGIPAVDQFLARFLHRWNGEDFRVHIFRLISYHRICSFQRLHDNILEPLRKLYFCSSVYFKCQVIHCLTALLHNLAAFEWPRVQESNKADEVDGQTPSILSSLFHEETEEFEGVVTLLELVRYISDMCVLGQQMDDSHNLLIHINLNFMELVASLFSQYNIPVVPFPVKDIFMRPFLLENAMGPARVCSIITMYKNSLELQKRQTIGTEYDEVINKKAIIRKCNDLILDVSDALLRNRAFTRKVDGSFFNFNPQDYSESLKVKEDVFTVYLHQAFLGFAMKFLKETQPIEQFGHPRGIKGVKETYFEFLEREHLDDIPKYNKVFIRKGNQSTTSAG
ncbi:centromere protein I [Mytilus galloprovincialis]|nr:centromere protein I [Mytilus galloprovincialis]